MRLDPNDLHAVIFFHKDEEEKPDAYKVVLICFTCDEYTTGWWSGSRWVGLAFNQSPPTYEIEPGMVSYWAYLPRKSPTLDFRR